MSFVSNGGKFKLYTVLNGLVFPTPTQPRISLERGIANVTAISISSQRYTLFAILICVLLRRHLYLFIMQYYLPLTVLNFSFDVMCTSVNNFPFKLIHYVLSLLCIYLFIPGCTVPGVKAFTLPLSEYVSSGRWLLHVEVESAEFSAPIEIAPGVGNGLPDVAAAEEHYVELRFGREMRRRYKPGLPFAGKVRKNITAIMPNEASPILFISRWRP
jgi:hypothetical protein